MNGVYEVLEEGQILDYYDEQQPIDDGYGSELDEGIGQFAALLESNLDEGEQMVEEELIEEEIPDSEMKDEEPEKEEEDEQVEEMEEVPEEPKKEVDPLRDYVLPKEIWFLALKRHIPISKLTYEWGWVEPKKEGGRSRAVIIAEYYDKRKDRVFTQKQYAKYRKTEPLPRQPVSN